MRQKSGPYQNWINWEGNKEDMLIYFESAGFININEIAGAVKEYSEGLAHTKIVFKSGAVVKLYVSIEHFWNKVCEAHEKRAIDDASQSSLLGNGQ